jgi:hypothetical protein
MRLDSLLQVLFTGIVINSEPFSWIALTNRPLSDQFCQ